MSKKPRLYDGKRSTWVFPEWTTAEMIQENPLCAWEALECCFTEGREVPPAVKDYFVASANALLGLLGEKPGQQLPERIAEGLKLKRDQANKGGTVFADYNRGVWRHHLYLKVKALREEQPSPGLTRGLSRGNALKRVAAEIGCSQSTLEGIFKEEQAKDNAASAGKGSGVFIDRRGPREI